jgi:hypothetical protein
MAVEDFGSSDEINTQVTEALRDSRIVGANTNQEAEHGTS